MVEAGCRTYVICNQCGLLLIEHEEGAFSDPKVIKEAEKHVGLEGNLHEITIRETWGKVDLEVIGDRFVSPVFYNDSPPISDNG